MLPDKVVLLTTNHELTQLRTEQLVDFKGVNTIFFPVQIGASFKYSRPLATWLKQSAPERDGNVQRDVFARLLDRAAGCEVSSPTGDTMLDDLEACVVGPA